jgi:hypothetical protein
LQAQTQHRALLQEQQRQQPQMARKTIGPHCVMTQQTLISQAWRTQSSSSGSRLAPALLVPADWLEDQTQGPAQQGLVSGVLVAGPAPAGSQQMLWGGQLQDVCKRSKTGGVEAAGGALCCVRRLSG